MSAAAPVEQPPALHRLRAVLAAVADLGHAEVVLDWDSRVGMPARGAGARAEASATVGRLAHELLISDEVGELLERLRPYEQSLDPGSDEASLIRVTRRDWERERHVSPQLAGELRRENGHALAAWDEAKARSDISIFAPFLERQLDLRRRYVECFPPAAEPYDVLLEDYEPGMTSAELRRIFDEVKNGLAPLIERARDERVDDSFLSARFPIDAQREASRRVLAAFGYEDAGWRLDPTTHPFASNPGVGDVRLTTSYREENLHSLFSTMHEFGHGVYEWGVDPALGRTPLGHGASSAIHESQSRTWENLVGLSRSFWRFFYPHLQELFSDQLGSVREADFVRAVNRIRPGLVRVDADEVTYNLHVILRFELEQELLAGTLPVRDVPEAWNAKMQEYLGVTVPDDARGALQDMHWAAGLFGYFPTYSLGNVLSVQFWEVARAELADLDEQFARADFAPLREWLRERIYRHGRKFTPQELAIRITGGPIDPGPYLGYLRAKFS